LKTKILITFFILLLFPGLVRSQCYTVLSVKGEIILEKSGQPVKEMDEICATDKLVFSTADSKAAVLSPEQGRFVIKLGKKKANELIAFVSSVLVAGNERLSTKFIDFDELELENSQFYKNEFGDSYFIIRESKIFVDKKYFPMNENNYFYIKYIYDGKEIESKLKFNKDTLFLNRGTFKIEGNIIDAEKIDIVNLYYFDKEKSKEIKLSSLNLSFANEEKLKSELSNYISILKKAEKNDYIIMEQVIYFLNDVYGNVNWYDVSTYLNENFGIK
jgi:hypothetical protein